MKAEYPNLMREEPQQICFIYKISPLLILKYASATIVIIENFVDILKSATLQW